MKRNFLPAIRFLSSVLFVLGFAACNKRETPVQAGIRTQTLLIGNKAEPEELDPHVVFLVTDGRILAALFEGLTAIDGETNRAVPAAADHWGTSPDGRVYSFHLRPELKWSNGDPVTADDFAFAFRRILTPAMAARYGEMLWPIKNAEAFQRGQLDDFGAVGVRALDARTLRIELERPTTYLPELAAHWTWYPVHRPTLEKFGAVSVRGTKWTHPGNLTGNGAFTLKEWTPHSRITVSKNPHYWDAARVPLNQIVFYPIETGEIEENNFRAGQQHITWDMPTTKIPAYRARTPSQFRNDAVLGTWYVNFNVTRGPLADWRVRRALGLVVDREALSQAVFSGARAPAWSFTPPNCGAYTARAKIGRDVETARQLLAEAGYPGGKGLPELPLEVTNDNFFPRIAEVIQADWQRELGVRTSIQAFEMKIVRQYQEQKRHTIALWAWIADFPDPAAFLELFTSAGGNNRTAWANPEYDRLIKAAANCAEPQARLDLFQQAEALLLEQAPIIPLIHTARVYLIHPAVKGWAPSLMAIPRYQLVSLEASR